MYFHNLNDIKYSHVFQSQFLKNHFRIKMNQNKKYQHQPLQNHKVQVISRFRECRRIMQTIRTHLDEYNVLGFDCEWVSKGKDRQPIALLQLASHRGVCALIRLCHLRNVPKELKEILEDNNIVKVGVDSNRDAEYLFQDYDIVVPSTLDLRYLAEAANCQPGGLAKMAEKYLNVKSNKQNWRIHHMWEKPNLTREQIDYAAMDAHNGIELFKFYSQKIQSKQTHERKTLEHIIDKYCTKHFDTNYIDKSNSSNPNSNTKSKPKPKQNQPSKQKRKRNFSKNQFNPSKKRKYI